MLVKLNPGVTVVEDVTGRYVFNGVGPLELFWEDFRHRRTFVTSEAAEVYLMRFYDQEE